MNDGVREASQREAFQGNRAIEVKQNTRVEPIHPDLNQYQAQLAKAQPLAPPVEKRPEPVKR